MDATIDLGLVSAFVAVGELSSFSAAARRLGVTTATISRNIARLEQKIGTQLVHRTSRHVSLSTAGKALFERSASHIHAVRSALANLPESQEEPAGTLRLIARHEFGITLLSEAITRYLARYPGVRVEVELTHRNVDFVADGFDLALQGYGGKLRDSSLAVRRLLEGEFRCYAAPTYVARRGTPRGLGAAEHDWVLLHAASKRLGLPATTQPRVSSNDYLFLRESTRAGVGIGVLPTFLAEPLLVSGELVVVLPSFHKSFGTLVMIHRRSGPLAPKISAFREVLSAMLKRGTGAGLR
jgi:DNA-binding transcriptional LysR family regulator